jgi:hypothetical protein
MIPFDTYKMAQDREQEIRKTVYIEKMARSRNARQSTLQRRLAGLLRGVADRLDPAQHSGSAFSRKVFTE